MSRTITALFLSTLFVICGTAQATCGKNSRSVVVIHGGAGDWKGTSPEATAAYLQHASDALHAAHELLHGGGSSLDAVITAIEIMENRGFLNAGKGAVRNSANIVELDASLMDGRTGLAGAVAAVKTIQNPIRAARHVMDSTKHVLLVASGAEKFSEAQGLVPVPPSYFEQVKPKGDRGEGRRYGTVGAVALDCDGHLAAGTSTGGLSGKLPGRVGDSPLIGAGNYANDATCAVSGTGTGEFFIRGAAAFDVSARMLYGAQSLLAATEATLSKLGPPNTGGLIAVDKQGNISTPFNTSGMLRGWVREDGVPEVHLL